MFVMKRTARDVLYGSCFGLTTENTEETQRKRRNKKVGFGPAFLKALFKAIKMKTIIQIIFTGLLVASSCNIFAQTWPKMYGEIGRMDFSYEICESYDNGYYILGGYDNSNFVPKYTWLIKTDINGEVLWEKILQCNGFVKSFAIEPANDGGLLIGGGILLNEFGLNYFPYVVKLNSCGDKEWCKVFMGVEGELPWVQDVLEAPSGEIVLLVNQYGEISEETLHLFKLNSFGEVLWKKPYASGYIHPQGVQALGNKLLITNDNKYLITGSIYWEEPWNPGGDKVLRSLYVMVDSYGEENWILPFGIQDTIYGKALMSYQLTDSTFLGVGSNWTNEIKPLFMEFNKDGIELNHSTIDMSEIDPNIGDGILTRVRKIDSIFFFGGGFYISNPEIHDQMEVAFDNNFLNPNYTIYDYFIHYDKDSPYDLITTNGSNLLSNSKDITNSPYFDIYLAKMNQQLEFETGNNGNYTYDSLCLPGPPQSGFIFLDTCDIITGIEIPTPEEYYARLKIIPVTVYPNPVRDKVTFTLENTEHHQNIKLKCFSLMGKQVYETNIITGQQELGADVDNWPEGMYLVVVYSDGLPVGRCKFVVQ